ncbi:hypothetical protein RB595_006358 [Gaeumannomyces hyphopodioides]
MASPDDEIPFNDDLAHEDEGSILSPRGLEAFGRKVTSTASHLIRPSNSDPTTSSSYQSTMTEVVQKHLRRPDLQRSMFSMARTTPSDLVRSKLSTKEIQHRALAHVPDELLDNIPDDENDYSLFQGFQATFPELTDEGKKHRRRVSRGRRLLDEAPGTPEGPHGLQRLRKERAAMAHELEMLGIRKSMASCEIREIDTKISNLYGMRKIILDRLAVLEQEETILEHDLMEVETRVDDAQELVDEAESLAGSVARHLDDDLVLGHEGDMGFMSQSIYEKIPSTGTSPSKGRKPRVVRRRSAAVLHEHFEPGTSIRELRAHNDRITAVDFDAPFGTLVTAAMDDSVKVWDLNVGRCIGLIDGHTASVRALQVVDNLLATGSADATVRLWDLSRAHYDPHGGHFGGKEDDDDEAMAFENPDDQPVDPPAGSMADCPVFTLSAHMDEVTALHFKGNTLVSGSADKTLRQWDLEKGRCVQTLDVMWAAAQASSGASEGNTWRQTTRSQADAADFVGSLQVFDAALACGTADGMVRLWDLRSGQVHRSLVGHTGPVTCLQFDDVHLVTGSLDRSIRIWDLRTGSIYDAYAYENGITSMMFDTRRIVSAAGEDVVKVYDKAEGRQWDCGAGIKAAEELKNPPAIVERVRIKDSYLVEGRKDGIVGVWTC